MAAAQRTGFDLLKENPDVQTTICSCYRLVPDGIGISACRSADHYRSNPNGKTERRQEASSRS